MGQLAEGEPLLAADPAGDAALKANNPAQAERYYQQARTIDNSDSYAVLGLGDAAAARKDNDAAERYYRQALRMDSGNSNAVRGLANIYRAQSPEKASQFIQSLSASQRRSIDDIERSLTNEQLSARAEQLENRANTPAAEVQRRRLALSPATYGSPIACRAISTAQASAVRQIP